MAISPFRIDLGPALLLAAAVVALGTAYGSEHWGGLAPCKLCLYQRWPWWLAGGLAILVLVLGERESFRSRALTLIGIVLLAGAGIAVYHVGVEQQWWPGPAGCSGDPNMADSLQELFSALKREPVVRCDEPPWTFLGISMAGYNAVVSTVTGLSALKTGLKG